MKAAVIEKYGSPNVVKFKEVVSPIPQKGEVLIRVKASSINSWDWDYMRGRPYIYRLLFGLRKPKHKVLGADVAGVVEAVGKDVTQFKKGDEVFGDVSGENWGGFSEYTCASEKVVCLKPLVLSFEEVAAIPQAAVLALQGLTCKRELQSGQKVLIVGAGGGVGAFAIQLAKMFGSEVTGVDRTEKQRFMKNLGADHVVDFTQEDVTIQGNQFDYILDVMGKQKPSNYFSVMKKEGRYVMLGGSVSLIFKLLFLKLFSLKKAVKNMHILAHRPNAKDLATLLQYYAKGELKSVIDKTCPLRELPKAMKYYGSGMVKGKVVITIP